MHDQRFNIYVKLASWTLPAAALIYLAYDLLVQGPALVPHWPALLILLLPAMLASAMTTLRRSSGLPRLSLSYVLAALLALPSPAGLLVATMASLAGSGGGIVGPRERSVRVFAIGVTTLALAQFLTTLVRQPDASSLHLLLLAPLLFGFIQAFCLSLTVLTGELAGDESVASAPAPWTSLLLESVNVPLAWLLADALVRQAWIQAAVFCAVLLAGEAALCRFSDTLREVTRNHSKLSAHLSELDTLHAIGREIVSSPDPEKVFSVVERECRKILALDYCFIALAEPDSSRLRAVHRHRRGEPSPTPDLLLEEGLAMQVAAEKRARRIDDFDLLPPGSPLRSGLVGPHMRSALTVPLIVEERVVGVLSIQSRHVSAYDDHQLTVLTTVAQLAAVAIENARRYQLATVDSLTGFLLRDYFFKRLGEEHHRVSRYGGTFSLLMMDLDGFKAINDRYGHLAGDQYLREVSQAIRGELRSADLACRYGGDEFCLLLPETELPGARAIAERIRQAVGGRIVSVEGVALRTTASIGVTVHPAHEAHDVAGLLRHADQALYRAKRSGRDCVRPYAA